MKKKILFISHDGSLSGAPLVLLYLIRWIKNNREDIECAVLIKQYGPLTNEFKKVCETYNYEKSRKYVIELPRRAYQIIRKNRQEKLIKKLSRGGFNVIFSNTITNGELLQSFKLYTDIPVIVHVHEMRLTIMEFGMTNMLQNFNLADSFIADSKITGIQLQELLKGNNIEGKPVSCVNEFIEQIDTVDNIKRNNDHFVVGGSGSFSWRKGIELFIFVAAVLIKNDNKIKFCWVGGNHESIEFLRFTYLLETLRITSNFEFVSHTDNPSAIFKTFDLFFLSSLEEPFSLVCLENAFLRKPVVCFKGCSGMEDLLIPEAGIAVPLGDINAAAEEILMLLMDENKRKEMGERGRALVLENAMVNKNAPFIMEVIDRHL